MSAYKNDPRVQWVNEGRALLPSPQGWYVEFNRGEWIADAAYEAYNPSRYGTADEAINAVIGEPQVAA